MDDNMELSNIQESNQNEDIVKDNQENAILSYELFATTSLVYSIEVKLVQP